MPDRRVVNPLAWETPAVLDKLFFQPLNALTPGEVDFLRTTPWLMLALTFTILAVAGPALEFWKERRAGASPAGP